jgi:hypothetical protein
MTPFHPQQSNRGRCVRKNANVNTFNFTSQIAPPICAVMHTEHDKSDTTIFKSLCKRMAVNKCFYRVEALPLVKTRFFRLARISPMAARSPARRSCDGRETSGKKSGGISRVMAAQLLGNSRATANAMPPDGRADNSQDNLFCAGLGRAMSAPETGEITRNMVAQLPCRSPRNCQCNISQAARGNSVVSF